jgi:hypothetical protein
LSVPVLGDARNVTVAIRVAEIWQELRVGAVSEPTVFGVGGTFFRAEKRSWTALPPAYLESSELVLLPAAIVRNTSPLELRVTLGRGVPGRVKLGVPQSDPPYERCTIRAQGAMAYFGAPAELRLAGSGSDAFSNPVEIRAPKDEEDEFIELSLDVLGAPQLVIRRGHDPVIIAARVFINCSGVPISVASDRGTLNGDVVVLPALEEKEEITLQLSRTSVRATQALPSDWSTMSLALENDKRMGFSLQATSIEGTFGKGRAFHLYPGAIITNSTEHSFDVRERSIGQPNPFGRLDPGGRLVIVEHLRSPLTVELALAGTGAWSAAIPLVDSASGSQDLVMGEHVLCAQLVPLRGLISLALCPGSRLRCANETGEEVVVSTLEPKPTQFNVEPHKTRDIGFVSPFFHPQLEVNVQLGTRTARAINLLAVGNQPGGGFTVSVTLQNGLKVLTVTDGEGERPVPKNREIILSLPRVGVSLVTDREAFYAEAAVVRARSMSTSEKRVLSLAVSEVQADFRCEGREMPVVLANRAEGERPALLLEVAQAASLQEVSHYLKVDVTLDDIEVDASDALLQFITGFSAACRTETKDHATLEAQPLVDTFEVPPVPSIVQVDNLKINAVGLHLWCKLALANVRFLPQALKVVVALLSVSGNFTLDGALVTLEERKFEGHRGSMGAFLDSLRSEYTSSFLQSLFSLLGHSSLLNVPKVPLKIGQNTVGYALTTAATTVDEVGGLVERLTFDDEYVKEQQRLRKTKRLTGVGDGLVEGSKRIGEGVLGLFDVIVKPIEGVNEGKDVGEKIGGFFGGLVKGAVGTVVKPVSKIGQAATDIVGGVKATVCEEADHAKRLCELERRPQRLLYGPLRAAKEFSIFDAIAKAQLGPIDGVEAVIPLGRTQADANRIIVLLVFATSLILCEMAMPVKEKDQEDEELDVLSHSVDNILTQLFRPATKTFDMLEKSVTSNPEAIRNVKSKILLADIEDIRVTQLGIEITARTGTLIIPTTGKSDEVKAELLHGIQRSTQGRSPDWTRLREAVWREREGEKGESAEEHDIKVVSVWQFERFYLGQGWTAPGGMVVGDDNETKWVWCDASRAKHPRLQPGLSLTVAQAAKVPPIEMGSLWTTVEGSAWEYRTGSGTDAEGWMYAFGMSAGTWDPANGTSTFVRKREWIRQYR